MKKFVIALFFILGQILSAEAQECVRFIPVYNDQYTVWDNLDGTFSLEGTTLRSHRFDDLTQNEVDIIVNQITYFYNVWDATIEHTIIEQENQVIVIRDGTGDIIGEFLLNYGFRPFIER